MLSTVVQPSSVVDIFPLLCPETDDYKCFSGYLTTVGSSEQFPFRIQLPTGNVGHKLREAKVWTSATLISLLQPVGGWPIVQARLHSAPDLVSFLLEMRDLLVSCLIERDMYRHRHRHQSDSARDERRKTGEKSP